MQRVETVARRVTTDCMKVAVFWRLRTPLSGFWGQLSPRIRSVVLVTFVFVLVFHVL